MQKVVITLTGGGLFFFLINGVRICGYPFVKNIVSIVP